MISGDDNKNPPNPNDPFCPTQIVPARAAVHCRQMGITKPSYLFKKSTWIVGLSPFGGSEPAARRDDLVLDRTGHLDLGDFWLSSPEIIVENPGR